MTPHEHKKQIEELGRYIDMLIGLYKRITPSHLEALKLQIHAPGLVTPAEMAFTKAMLQSLTLHAQALHAEEDAFLTAASLVGK